MVPDHIYIYYYRVCTLICVSSKSFLSKRRGTSITRARVRHFRQRLSLCRLFLFSITLSRSLCKFYYQKNEILTHIMLI